MSAPDPLFAVSRSTRLSPRQRTLIEQWEPTAELVADLSWRLGGTTVLLARAGDTEIVVKAGERGDLNVTREIEGREHWAGVWVELGVAAKTFHADSDANILLLEHLPGDLIAGSEAAIDPEVHRRAGELLRVFHDQRAIDPADSDEEETRRASAWLDSAHRIDADAVQRLRYALSVLPGVTAPLVPTHGDFQPRNWLLDDGEVRFVDFGRFGHRAAATDFARMAAQEWLQNPACETAFIEGYGIDPRDDQEWLMIRLRQAIETAAWAYQAGDPAFEQQGLRMVDEVLEDLEL
ncbi:phosphotransferase [Microbacterium marmarense]|uniref:Phosphotransferase n=1 Tax=Microbacterium marmarense TaxID=3122051 RepID=A0ABU8LVU9_9MICO